MVYTCRPAGLYFFITYFYKHIAPLGLYPFIESYAYTPFVPLELRPLNQKSPQIREIRIIRENP